LKTLVLSKVSIFSKLTVQGLSEALQNLPHIKYLDLSHNGIIGQDLGQILEVLCHEHGCQLRSLNISGNNAVPFEYRGLNGQVIEKFSDRL
jgi:hypothetical protein